MAVHRQEDGQASVEFVALLPLAALVALAIGQLLAAGSARELAGAPAAGVGAAPPPAAPPAGPGGGGGAPTTVHVAGRRVEVHVRPRTVVPLLAERLEASATADAGPQ